MADEMTPALTLDPTSPSIPFTVREIDAVDAVAEWLAFRDAMLSRAAQEGHGEHFAQTEAVARAAERGDLHAAAALALFRQAFGFTHKDVRLLREMEQQHGPASDLASLAARIAALLPPE